jgi:hypothetical protein
MIRLTKVQRTKKEGGSFYAESGGTVTKGREKHRAKVEYSGDARKGGP